MDEWILISCSSNMKSWLKVSQDKDAKFPFLLSKSLKYFIERLDVNSNKTFLKLWIKKHWGSNILLIKSKRNKRWRKCLNFLKKKSLCWKFNILSQINTFHRLNVVSRLPLPASCCDITVWALIGRFHVKIRSSSDSDHYLQ